MLHRARRCKTSDNRTAASHCDTCAGDVAAPADASRTYTGKLGRQPWPGGNPTGVSGPKFETFSPGMVEGTKGVQIGPGATLFTPDTSLAEHLGQVGREVAMAALVTA